MHTPTVSIVRKLFVMVFLGLALPAGTASASTNGPSEMVESAMVKIAIKDGEKTIRHPGQECEHQAEYEIFLKQGKVKYVVTVLIDQGSGDDKYKVKLSYKRNGKTVVSGDLDLTAKKTGSLSKGKHQIFINVDPAGRVDGRDKIEGPSGDDPLDGAPGG
jgi:hypothetical protein